jgi:hypothetical protein
MHDPSSLRPELRADPEIQVRRRASQQSLAAFFDETESLAAVCIGRLLREIGCEQRQVKAQPIQRNQPERQRHVFLVGFCREAR